MPKANTVNTPMTEVVEAFFAVKAHYNRTNYADQAADDRAADYLFAIEKSIADATVTWPADALALVQYIVDEGGLEGTPRDAIDLLLKYLKARRAT